MTACTLYERLIADGTIHTRHEITLGRYLACRKAAEKIGILNAGNDHPDFLVAQYHYCWGNFGPTYYLIELLTAPPDERCTLAHMMEGLGFQMADIDTILDDVAEFLAVDHPAIYREEKRREAEMYKRWEEHPEERPAFLRRTRERA